MKPSSWKKKALFIITQQFLFSYPSSMESCWVFFSNNVFITLTHPHACTQTQSSLWTENQAGAAKVQRRSFAKITSRSVLGIFRFLYSIQPRFMSLLCLLNLQETWAQFCLCWQFLGVDSCRLFTRCQGMSNPEHVFLSYSHSLTAEVVCSLSDPFADI